MPGTIEHPDLKVSVIIPTYNRAGYLREALDSVFRQSLAPWEIIVVDDGSTDDTDQVIHDALMPVRYFKQDHCGVAVARNLGLENAMGDLVAWLDSDDLWEPDFLATVVPLFAQDQTLGGVYTGIMMIDADGVWLGTSLCSEPPDRLYAQLIRGNFLATPSVVVRKACYDQIGGFDVELRISEDYDMWLRLTERFQFVGIPQPLVAIRVHATNTMADIDTFCQARLTLLKKRFGVLQNNARISPENSRIAYGYTYRTIATKYVENGQPELGWSHLMKAVVHHPRILAQSDTFYELALGTQPRGYRGDVARLDIVANGTEMLSRLEVLFASANVAEVQALRGIAFGNAYLVLAMLSDQAGQWRPARRYILRSLRSYPAFVFRPGFVRRLAKLLLGKHLINWLRGLRHREDDQSF